MIEVINCLSSKDTDPIRHASTYSTVHTLALREWLAVKFQSDCSTLVHAVVRGCENVNFTE